MNRREFLAGCVASTCAASAFTGTLLGSATAAAAPEGPFAGQKLRMSVPFDWFKGSFDEKLEQIAKWGFPAYEWLNPKGDLAALRAKADSLGLELSCMVGAWGIRPGGMVNPADHEAVVADFTEKVQIAHQLNCRHLIGLTGNEAPDVPRDQQTAAVIDCLKKLAPIAEKENVILVVEMLNTLVDHEGYFLSRTDHGVEIMKAVGSPNVKLLFDIYHQQITEGNVIRNLKNNIDYIGHFHLADNPGRKEPGTGELNYTKIFQAVADTGYKDFVALECSHTKNKEETLNATLACLKG